MSSESGTRPGRAVWHDLFTTDVARASRFYAELLGWEISGADDHPVVEVDGRQHAGFVSLDTGTGLSSHWLAYVPTDGVDDLARRAEELGGRVLTPPTDDPRTGRFAILGDPEGAVIAALSLARSPSTEGVFVWDEVMTTDHEDAQRFYRGLFGWRCHEDHVGPSGTYRFFQQGAENVAGLMEKPYYLALPLWTTYLAVADVGRVADGVLELGGTIAVEPTDVVGIGRFGIAIDPTGAVFGIFRPA